MLAIEVKNLKKYYDRGKVKAVDGISFKVPEGARYGFLGPNGAGKTTTIRCLLGLLHPNAGTIKYFGKKIKPTKDVGIRNQIGYLPGELGLYKYMTPVKLVKYFSKLYDIDIDWSFVNEVAERLNIAMERKIGDLSKGNKQKVGVLTALMGKFKLLIMDEPTSGLDPLMQSEFYKIVAERQKVSNCTVFVSSHVLPEVEKFCDQVAIIRKGKIAEVSSVHNLKAKSLKHIELLFDKEESSREFEEFLRKDYPDAQIKQNFNTEMIFLLKPDRTVELMRDISERKWSKKKIRDFTIKHSSLENIFLEFYKNSKGGN